MAKLSDVMKFRLEWKCQYLKEKKGKVALVFLSEMALLASEREILRPRFNTNIPNSGKLSFLMNMGSSCM